MKYRNTERGFKYYEFLDRSEQKCTLQESSLASEHCVWLGVHEPKPRVLTKGEGWQDVPLPDDAFISSRMHLTIEQTKELIELLQKFVDTGELPEPDMNAPLIVTPGSAEDIRKGLGITEDIQQEAIQILKDLKLKKK